MTRILVLSTHTERDLFAAMGWYNHIRPGLGDDFLLCVEQALHRILEFPEASPAIAGEVRRTLVRRFPYAVLYRIRPRRIEGEAIFPLRANPSRVRDRLHPMHSS